MHSKRWVIWFSGKLLPLYLRLKCTKSFVGWATPQTPLGEITALPRPQNWIFVAYFLRESKGGKWKE